MNVKKPLSLILGLSMVLSLAMNAVAADPAAAESGYAERYYRVAEPTAWNFDLDQITKVYAYNPSEYTYSRIDNADATTLLQLIKKAGRGTPEGIYTTIDAGFFIFMDDGSKFTYTLIPTAIRSYETTYPLSTTDYNTLKGIASKANAENPSTVQWLTYMSTERIKGAAYSAKGSTKDVTVPEEYIPKISKLLKAISVQKGSGKAYAKGDYFFDYKAGRTVIRLDFQSEIYYLIAVENGKLYLESSDMDYGCVYDLKVSEDAVNRYLDALI